MAILSNINDKFAVDSTGAIQFNGQAGTSGYVLKSNGNAAPTWVDASTVIGGPYLPLSGGTLTGATATASGISFTVGGVLNGTSATFSGSVGIGTNSPDYLLDLYKSTGTTSSATGTTLQRLWNYVGSDLNQQKTFIDFVFQDDNDNEYPQVRIGAEVGQNGNANTQEKEGSGAFVVYTNNATGVGPGTPTGLEERFRVDYQGNVGINKANPSYKLDVEGDVRLGGTEAQNYPIKMGRDNNAVYLGGPNINTINVAWDTDADYNMHLNYVGYAGGVTQFRNLVINDGKQGHIATFKGSTGNVGIGTDLPFSKLTVSRPGINEGTISFDDQANNAHLTLAGTDSLVRLQLGTYNNGNYGGWIQASYDNGGVNYGTEPLILNPQGGNVGIGTTSPGEKLEVNGNIKGGYGIFNAESLTEDLRVGGIYGNLGLYIADAYDMQFSIGSTNSKWKFTLANVDKFIITPNGDTTANGSMVWGNGIGRIISNQLQSGFNSDTEDNDFWINYTGYQGGTTRYRDFRIGNGKQGQMAFFDGSTGYSIFTGNVGIGTTLPGHKLEVNGGIRAGIAGGSSGNIPGLKVYAASAQTDTTAAIAIQQGTGEGDTIIFADYEPHVEWGISAQNSTDQIHFTAGSSTNNLGSKTFYNNAGAARTAYIKFNHDLSDGTTLVGGQIGMGRNYNGGIYAINTSSTPGIDSNWGLEVQRTADVNDYNTRLKYYPVSGQSRKAGIYDSRNARFSLYSDTNNNPDILIPHGFLGIGNTSPTYRLQLGTSGDLASSIRLGTYAVAKNTRQYIGYTRADSGLFETTGDGDTPSTVLAGVAGVRIVNTAGSLYSGQADNSVQLLTHIYNGGSRVALHASYNGNVGIGTTSPSATFQVNGNTNFGNAAQPANTSNYINNFNNDLALLIKKISTGVGDYLSIQDSTGSSKFIVKSSGNVGIGTASPSGPFHVKVGTSTPLIVASSSYCNNVGIRTTTPTASLQVKGNVSYSYNNYTNVATTWINVINFSGYPAGLYQISIIKKTDASTYITAIVKWSGTAGTVVSTIASNQLGIGFNGSTILQAISGIATGTLMSANLQCLVTNEDFCS
jgi:hypothetical protein